MIRQRLEQIRSASMHSTTSAGSLEPALRTIETETDAKRLWKTSPGLRDQFDSGSILWHYVVAVRRGLVRD